MALTAMLAPPEVPAPFTLDDVDETLEAWIFTATSRLIGTMNGRRGPAYKFASMIALMATLPFTSAKGVEAPIAPELELTPSNGDTVLKHNNWTPAYLDDLWGDQLADMDMYATLPEEVVDAFVAPELRRVLAVLANRGPVEMHARLVAALRSKARREATSGARKGKKVGGGTLDTLYSPTRRFMKVLCSLRSEGYTAPPGSPAAKALEKWDVLPQRIDARNLSRAEDGGKVPRHPPTERLIRLGLARQFDLLPLCYRANGKLRDRSDFKPFRDAALVGLVCPSGSRETAFFLRPDGPVAVSDYEPAHHFDRTNYVGPALRIFVAKKGSEQTQERAGYTTQWIALPPPVAAALETYMEIVGIRHRPDAPLWIKEWADEARTIPNLDAPLDVRAFDYIVAKAFDPRFLRGGYLFAPHDIRHTAEPALAGVGQRWLDGKLALPPGLPRPTETESVAFRGQVVADATLSHSYRGLDPNGYKHCEDNRERFALVGVFGMWELLTGESGALHGVDLERRMRADQHYSELQAEVAGCESRLAALGDDMRALIRQMAGPVGRGDGFNRLQARKWELDEERLLEQARLDGAKMRLKSAKDELAAAYQARVPLPDNWLPERDDAEPIGLKEAAIRTHRTLANLYWHLHQGHLGYERRGRYYYVTIGDLREAGLLAAAGEAPPEEEHPDVSPHLTDGTADNVDDVPVGARVPLAVAARIFMKDVSTLKRWSVGTMPFPPGDPRNPWQPSPDPGKPPECIDGAPGTRRKHVIVTPTLALWLRRHPEIRERFALALAARL